MEKPTNEQVTTAKAEIEAEDSRRRANSVCAYDEQKRIIAENQRKSSLPSEDPEHIHGMMCDGQDGMNSYCERLRRKLFCK